MRLIAKDPDLIYNPALNYFFENDISLNMLKEKFIDDVIADLTPELLQSYEEEYQKFQQDIKLLT